MLRERRGAKPVAQATTGDMLVKKVEKVSAVAGVAATSLGAVRSALPEDVFTILTYGGLGLAGVYLVATVIRRARG